MAQRESSRYVWQNTFDTKFIILKTHIMRASMICSSEDLLKTCELLLLLKPKLREPLKFFHKGENSDLNRDCLSEDLKHSTFQYWLCHANEGPSWGWALRWTMSDRLLTFTHVTFLHKELRKALWGVYVNPTDRTGLYLRIMRSSHGSTLNCKAGESFQKINME